MVSALAKYCLGVCPLTCPFPATRSSFEIVCIVTTPIPAFLHSISRVSEQADIKKRKSTEVPIIKFRKQYSIADAWLKGNIAKYQQKLSGRRSADFKFLFHCLECSTCVFLYKESFIPIGEKTYTNVCINTDVWLDGDFISTFASLVCHNNHSLAPTALLNSGKDVPQLSHVTFPNSVMTPHRRG